MERIRFTFVEKFVDKMIKSQGNFITAICRWNRFFCTFCQQLIFFSNMVAFTAYYHLKTWNPNGRVLALLYQKDFLVLPNHWNYIVFLFGWIHQWNKNIFSSLLLIWSLLILTAYFFCIFLISLKNKGKSIYMDHVHAWSNSCWQKSLGIISSYHT